MAGPTITVVDTPEAVARGAAERFVALAKEAVAARGRFTVAFSGGSTPRALFQLLAKDPFRAQVTWDRLEIFWGDERSVPPTHQDSNYRMAKEGGAWKVYDVVVADLSLVQNYRGSFESEVRKGGIDGLVKALTDKNRQLSAQRQAAAK